MGTEFPSVIRLDIGGKKYSTTIETLTQREPDSMLAAMFSGRHTLSGYHHEGCIFVDRDGTHFRHILNWLRDGVVPILKDSEYPELVREAEYYQLLGLMENIHNHLNKEKVEDEIRTDLTRTDVIKCIQSEHVRLRGVNLSGLDLSKLDLSAVDFSFARLHGVLFSCANLQAAKFGLDVDAAGSIFQDATLRECELAGANLQRAILSRACLQSANLQDACLMSCDLSKADLRTAHLQTADLTDANLEGANLEGANLKGAKLYRANLRGANLRRAYLRQVDLRETITDGAMLEGANLLGAIR